MTILHCSMSYQEDESSGTIAIEGATSDKFH